MDEFGFIATHFAPLAQSPAALGLKDDAAVLSVPQGQELVITKDALVSGVHFIGDEPAHHIAQKLLAVNLSDLAAMGAVPMGYFLALMLPSSMREDWLADFANGLNRGQAEYGLSLMGGDTVRTEGPLTLSLTALGLVPAGEALRRSGAKAGDGIYVSGTIGDAALGLKVAQGSLPANAYLLGRYRLPQPRLALGAALRGIASACMDISDGLMQDLGHLCKASGIGAEIHYAHIPVSEAVRKLLAPKDYETVLAGGDDYELLFTVPKERESRLEEIAAKTNTAVTRIGRLVEGKSARVFDEQGQEIMLERKGYRHF